MGRTLIALSLLALAAACGPVPVAQAERMCVSDAQLAQHPRGSVGIGVGSDGSTGADITLGISSDFLLHRDPDAVFAACVQQRAGQPPTRPFSAMPESRM